MGNEYAGGIWVVTATKDRKSEYWAAAVPESQAIEAVRQQVAPGWKLALTQQRLSPAQIAELEMRPNSVRKLKETP